MTILTPHLAISGCCLSSRFALALLKTRWLMRKLPVGLKFGLWNTSKLFEVSVENIIFLQAVLKDIAAI